MAELLELVGGVRLDGSILANSTVINMSTHMSTHISTHMSIHMSMQAL